MDIDWPSLSRIAPWHWWVLGALLLILEVVAPGVFFVWLALAALGVASIVLGRRLLARLPHSAEADTLNQGGQRLIGRNVVLTEAIVNGQGRARVGDGTWSVRGPDVPAGTPMVIVSAEGTTLGVALAD